MSESIDSCRKEMNAIRTKKKLLRRNIASNFDQNLSHFLYQAQTNTKIKLNRRKWQSAMPWMKVERTFENNDSFYHNYTSGMFNNGMVCFLKVR